MLKIRVREVAPDKLDSYYSRLGWHMENIPAFKKLATKSEAGLMRGERGYQMIAAMTAGRLARVLGCNEDR